jgi:hypothetical protein
MGNKKRIYLSGPITGTTDYMERFSEAQKRLENLGYSVVNPALVNSKLPEDTTYEQYMKMSFTMLSMCNYIYMLQGYEKSNGAIKELKMAEICNISVMYEAVK